MRIAASRESEGAKPLEDALSGLGLERLATFSAPDTALMTLPNGRTTALRRHRF